MDYLKQFEKCKYIKEISQYINNVLKLRSLYTLGDYKAMINHINELVNKYFEESIIWNETHNIKPQTYYECYINAEAFLKAKGKVLLTKVIHKTISFK
jgi:hypothetical protein